MSRFRSSKAIAVTALCATLVGTTLAGSPVDASISNPGAVSFSMQKGFINITGPSGALPFSFPNLIGPYQCNDGIDNDNDTFIDGGDAQCIAPPVGGSLPVPASQIDDDESLGGYQGQYECVNGRDDDLNYTSLPIQVGAASSGNGTDSLVLNKPAGTLTGHLLIAVFAAKTTNPAEITDPAGFTRRGFTTTADGSAMLYTRVADGTEGASFTFQETMAGAQPVSGILATYRPNSATGTIHLINPIYGSPFAVNSSGTGLTTWSYPGVDNMYPLTRVIKFGAAFMGAGGGTWVAPNPDEPVPDGSGVVKVQSTPSNPNGPITTMYENFDYFDGTAVGTTSAAATSALRFTLAFTSINPTPGGADYVAPTAGADKVPEEGYVRKDFQCTGHTDNTEFATGDPSPTYAAPTFSGTVAANGDISITSVTQQKKWVHFATGNPLAPVAHAQVTFKYANLPITGQADPLTGEVTLDQVDVALFITIQGLGNCEVPLGAGGTGDPTTGTAALPPIASFPITNLTTGTSGALTGTPYNQTTGLTKLVQGDWGINFSAECGGLAEAAEVQMNAMLGLPSTGGNSLEFYLQSAPLLTSNPSVSGTVTDSVTANPLSGMKVGLYPSTGSGRLATATTDAEGKYAFEDLAAGNYRVKAWDPTGAHFAEWNLDQPDWASAANVAAAIGPTSVVDFALAPGTARIQGRVRDRNAVGVAPLAGATVTLYDAGGGVVAVDTSGPSGWYDFPALAPGSYKLKFSMAGYFTEWYQDAFTSATAATLTVVNGENRILDPFPDYAVLTRTTNPEIFGNVSDGGGALPGATVRLYTASGQVASTTTDGSGNYMFGGIAKHVDYFVRFEAAGHTQEWWNNSGPAFDDCSGVIPPCTPVVRYADALNWGGVAPFPSVDGSLV